MARKNQAAAKAHKADVSTPVTKERGEGRRLEPIVLSAQQDRAFKELTTTSAKIRFLHAEKFSRGQIASFLGKKYQHVRNVLITPLKKEEPATK